MQPLTYNMRSMNKDNIKFQQRVIFKCQRDGLTKRGMVNTIGDREAEILFYDGKYTSTEKVPFMNILGEDTDSADMRQLVSQSG